MAKVVLTYKKGSEEGVSSVGFFYSTEFDSMKNLLRDYTFILNLTNSLMMRMMMMLLLLLFWGKNKTYLRVMRRIIFHSRGCNKLKNDDDI